MSISAWDIKPGMKFRSKGEGGNIYTVICVDMNFPASIILKREKDGLELRYRVDRFIELAQKGGVKQAEV